MCVHGMYRYAIGYVLAFMYQTYTQVFNLLNALVCETCVYFTCMVAMDKGGGVYHVLVIFQSFRLLPLCCFCVLSGVLSKYWLVGVYTHVGVVLSR